MNENADKEAELRKELKAARLAAKKLAEEEELERTKEIARQNALKGMKYLLGISEKYSAFFQQKIFTKDVKRKPLQEENKIKHILKEEAKNVKIANRRSEGNKYADVSKFLKYFEGGSLRPYQLDGVSWMMVLYENGLNGILADEMGLGKTVQIIALISHLLERKILGPYLIVVPLSTLPNWQKEFEKFAPKVPVVVVYGSYHERKALFRDAKRKHKIDDFETYPVVLTSYNIPLMEKQFFQGIKWQYIIVDEGHKLKNHKSQTSIFMRTLYASNKLILTGTPLQNNITELWALLNFLLPDIFKNEDTFASLLLLEDMQDENKLLKHEEKNNLISIIHKVLAPFMLRRLKKDVLIDLVPKKEVTVYCPISKLQRDLYSYVLSRNLAKLRGLDEEPVSLPKRRRTSVKHHYAETTDEADDSDFENQLLLENEEKREMRKIEKKFQPFITRLTMLNTVMMFKKIVDHPYLVHFPLDPNSEKKQLLIDENLVESSGKMQVLDTMLPKLKARGHKVLIFSTLVMMLDLIEEFMILRNHSYVRLDGRYGLQERDVCITEFNNDPKIFAFLVSTRAGGLGLNLTGADTVIFFDNDWNPQADIQAQDRCHRIGQTRPVMVYTLVTRNTIDEIIVTRGHHKRILEKIIIKDGKFKSSRHEQRFFEENELMELQKLLEQENSNSKNGYTFSKLQLNTLLDRSELYKIMAQKKKEENKTTT